MNTRLLIFSPAVSSRLRYIAEQLLEHMGGLSITFTGEIEFFRTFDGPKINYSGEILAGGEFRIEPAPLLFETTIRPQEIPVKGEGAETVLFPVSSGDHPFDIFAASFYLLSRYEEYLPHTADQYGRFSHKESIAWKNDFLRFPLVDIWMKDLRNCLSQRFPGLMFRMQAFRFIPTYDIDMAYSYLHKGWKRNLGGLIRSVFSGKFSEAGERIAVLRGKLQDPFDAYEWLYALHLKFMLKPYYFFLVAKQRGAYDKNIDPGKPAMRELIQYHSMGYHIGIHPSWHSGDDPEMLEAEKKILEKLAGKLVIHSRQHYIRMKLPDTYQLLIENDILHDYSMGYGDINGFRASVCSPFYWYDFSREEKTLLRVHPFCFMDAAAYYSQKLTPGQAYEELKYYHDAVKRVNGVMMTIWHNSFLGTGKEFARWRSTYEFFLNEVVYWDV